MSPTASVEEIALAVQPSEGEDPFTWADNEAITILDHFKRKFENDTLYKLSNGKTYNQEELDDLIEKSREMNAQLEENRDDLDVVTDVENISPLAFDSVPFNVFHTERRCRPR